MIVKSGQRSISTSEASFSFSNFRKISLRAKIGNSRFDTTDGAEHRFQIVREPKFSPRGRDTLSLYDDVIAPPNRPHFTHPTLKRWRHSFLFRPILTFLSEEKTINKQMSLIRETVYILVRRKPVLGESWFLWLLNYDTAIRTKHFSRYFSSSYILLVWYT